MRIIMRGLGVLGAVLAMAGAGLFTTAAGASAQSAPMPARVAPTAVHTVFDLNGTYTDFGPWRPVVSNLDDQLRIKMVPADPRADRPRPDALGRVISANTIVVTFPDDATHIGTLVAPDTIRWSNNSVWRKLKRVPSLRGLELNDAEPVLAASGFRLGSVRTIPDRTCNSIGLIRSQNPAAGTPAVPGTAVSVTVAVAPTTPCP